MKVASLVFISGLVLIFLSLREDKNVLISRRKVIPVDRKIAAGETYKCMRDLFSVEELKREVHELETSLDTNRIKGKWKNLDLATLPTPAADFLKNHGDKLSSAGSMCEDIPCFYNEVYRTPEGIAGYVHYLWFLRTGTYLAADDQVPNQVSPTPGQYNGKSFPVSSYLFDNDELYGFWRLSKMLRAPHSTLTYLKEIQRVPRGEKFEGDNAVACGLAHSHGWITLSDQCLTVYKQSDSGYLFPAVLHEISHQLDFEEGRRISDDMTRSEKPDFLKLTGFELREFRNAQGQMVRQWIHSQEARLITVYANNSPAEAFAELLAYYRIEGESSKGKVKTDSWEFASTYYNGKSFEHLKMADQWIKEANSKNIRGILKVSANCKTPVCLEQELALLARDAIGTIRSRDPDGCRILNNPLIGQTLPLKMTAAFRETARSSEVSGEAGEEILARFDELMEPGTAYEAYFTCHQSGSDCYNDKVSQQKKIQFAEFDEASEKLLTTYLHTYSFEKIAGEITSFYQSLLSSRENILKLKADELWESCKKIPVSDSVAPTGSEYVLKEGYMVSSFYNCLNRGFNSSLNASLEAVKLNEFSPKNPQERTFIMSLMRPRFSAIMDDHLRSGRAWEFKYRDAFTEQQGAWLYKSIRSNRWWFPRGRVNQDQIESACRDSAVKMIGGEIFFHLKKDLYKELLEKTCKDIR